MGQRKKKVMKPYSYYLVEVYKGPMLCGWVRSPGDQISNTEHAFTHWDSVCEAREVAAKILKTDLADRVEIIRIDAISIEVIKKE